MALIFSETSARLTEMSSKQSVLFVIDIFDVSEETTPFALIKSHSCYQEEDEVLFTLGAVFKVRSVEQEDDMWHVRLQLNKKQDKAYRDLSNHMRKQIGDRSSSLALGWFLYRMNDFNKAKRYARSLLTQVPENSIEAGNAYNL